MRCTSKRVQERFQRVRKAYAILSDEGANVTISREDMQRNPTSLC